MHGVDDLSRRSLRELLTLARERLGRGAAELKTRTELIAALRQAERGAASPGDAPVGDANAASALSGALATSSDKAWAAASRVGVAPTHASTGASFGGEAYGAPASEAHDSGASAGTLRGSGSIDDAISRPPSEAHSRASAGTSRGSGSSADASSGRASTAYDSETPPSAPGEAFAGAPVSDSAARSSTSPSSRPLLTASDVPTVVTRDFFVARR